MLEITFKKQWTLKAMESDVVCYVKCVLMPCLLSLTLPIATDATASDAASFNDIATWGYQLTGYEQDGFQRLASAPMDLLVIDLARDGGDDYFTASEIQTLRKPNKIILAYFEIGAIEDYRPEWSKVPKDILMGSVDEWPSEQYVQYWDERWWPIIQVRIERALNAGFDGAYLDLITAYSEIPNSNLSSEERAKRMVALLVRISKFAKSKNSDFKIVAQNCPELATWSHWEPYVNQEYLDAIDGLAIESPFYLAHDTPCDEPWCQENLADAQFVKEQGKLLLGVDYAKTPRCIRDSYERQRQAGFVPYVSIRALDRLMILSDEDSR